MWYWKLKRKNGIKFIGQLIQQTVVGKLGNSNDQYSSEVINENFCLYERNFQYCAKHAWATIRILEWWFEFVKLFVWLWVLIQFYHKDEGKVWQGVQDLLPPIHRVQVVSRRGHAIQKNRNLPDLFQAEKCVPNLSTRSGVWWVADFF